VDQQSRIRNAAHRAKKVYPGPAGEVLARELDAYADFSFLWCDGSTTRRMGALVDDVLGRPVPMLKG
jgi:hypothetical protein